MQSARPQSIAARADKPPSFSNERTCRASFTMSNSPTDRASAAILGPIASIVISIAVNYDKYCQFAIQLPFARIPVIWPTHLSDF
jgi:hypothetical protein